MSSFALVHTNIASQHSRARQEQTIAEAASKAHILTVNENNDGFAGDTLGRLGGWEWTDLPRDRAARANLVAWRTDTFELLDQRRWCLMGGGGRPRRGPSRYAQAATLRHRASGDVLTVIATHLIAKAYTSQPWRRRLWKQSADRLVRTVIADVARRHPFTPIIMTGDFNRAGHFTLGPMLEVPTPPTYGRRRYDRIFVSGTIGVYNPRALRVGSDHKALRVRVTL